MPVQADRRSHATVVVQKAAMPRYVILEHDYPEQHWDFMLEAGNVLRTWRLARRPDATGPIEADLIFDHRLTYLDYEGPLSRDRGSVVRWDRGWFEWQEDLCDRVAVRLQGQKLHAAAKLICRTDGRWDFRVLGDAEV
jgi:hypothetical protein